MGILMGNVFQAVKKKLTTISQHQIYYTCTCIQYSSGFQISPVASHTCISVKAKGHAQTRPKIYGANPGSERFPQNSENLPELAGACRFPQRLIHGFII